MNKPKIIAYSLLGIIAAGFLFVILFFLFFTIMEYRPKKLETVSVNTESKNETVQSESSLKILSWNLGYCGLDAKNDFFYDGGKAVVARSKEAVLENFEFVKQTISEINADFNLLQEIDVKSKRSFYVPEKEMLQSYLKDEDSCFAANYNAVTVPFPFFNSLGKVHSGIFTSSKYKIKSAERHRLPGSFPWPLKTVNLKRCLLVSQLKTEIPDKDIYIINLHLSAYDSDGSMRKQELEYLRKLMLELYGKGHWVIAGGDWNSLFPGVEKDLFKPYTTDDSMLYWIQYLNKDFAGADWKWVFDKTEPTVRLLEKPYIKGENYTTIIDGFLVSPNVEILSVKTEGMDFAVSDHQPVIVEFKLKK
ncbi:endonuclease/exonuclease/phosphatase family protein [Treponema pedis]|uniref:Endonuclease/exonuclease/phosphatase familyprotein n=1 Tax=Treponema pedis str. T A4 TaxID=1291379 RepID=S5ZSB1_9SPIR|nr:endonuclease/exonuclease/phosphatase family protein [Treponema pedis]AGT42965.1 endonuclease/exonuclease/phosphatase familyprotein [Treponema pedis str. T A4]